VLHRLPRVALTLVLLSTMWMPAYTCAGYRAPDGAVVQSIPAGADSAAFVPVQVPHVPIREAELRTLDGWISLWPYVWIVPVLAFATWRPQNKAPDLITAGLGPFVAWVLTFRLVGSLAYGTYVALAATAGLWFLAIGALVTRWRQQRQRPRGV
jgi:hypothetical protein